MLSSEWCDDSGDWGTWTSCRWVSTSSKFKFLFVFGFLTIFSVSFAGIAGIVHRLVPKVAIPIHQTYSNEVKTVFTFQRVILHIIAWIPRGNFPTHIFHEPRKTMKQLSNKVSAGSHCNLRSQIKFNSIKFRLIIRVELTIAACDRTNKMLITPLIAQRSYFASLTTRKKKAWKARTCAPATSKRFVVMSITWKPVSCHTKQPNLRMTSFLWIINFFNFQSLHKHRSLTSLRE